MCKLVGCGRSWEERFQHITIYDQTLKQRIIQKNREI